MYSEKLTIVITSFHSQDKIFKCLESINSNIKTIIVENSNNNSLKKELQKKYKNVEIILSNENLGYAKGNNLGLSKVKTEYALILNPDVTIEKNTLENFFSIIEKEKNFAIISPEIQDEKKYLKENISRNVKLTQVQQIKGFAMFLNLKEFKEIGFFDENFFIYLEEIDLCKRLLKKNKKIFVDSRVKFFHLGGSSHNDSINYEMELSRNWHWMWSTFYFNKKHYGYFFAFLKCFKKLFSSLAKIIYYTFTFNQKKKNIYLQRFLGLINSMIGKKSWYRPKVKI